MTAPQLVVLAGPNGAGTSTFYAVQLSASRLPFLNADELVARTGIDAAEAQRILDLMRDRLIDEGRGFITETVFSDPVGAELAMLKKAVDAGYDVTLIFVGIAGPALSSLRIDQRVAEGGHDVPRDRLAGRHERSLANLSEAIAFVPTVKLYDNSSVDEPHRPIAVFERGVATFVASDRIPRWAAAVLADHRVAEAPRAAPAGRRSPRRPKPRR